MNWTPRSWRAKPALQQPTYERPADLERVVDEIRELPPLVTAWEVEQLKGLIAKAARGECFLLQGGDCAETFAECRADVITNKLKVLLQMSLVLVQGAKQPVIRVGRFAGQYAKPRSEDLETRDGVTLPSYRGDIVNRPGFTLEDRRPDPELLIRGYERAALTLNLIRALSEGGFADLHHPEYWDLDFVEHSPFADDYRRMVESIAESLRFMENVLGVNPSEIRKVDFYSSHEGLHLHYEEAQTRLEARTGRWYNLSTHLPWIGLRTSEPEGAHVEYFRGIANPIAAKVGPGTASDRIERLLETLDPEREPGRLTLIHRMGASKIEEHLGRVIDVVARSGHKVLWVCDPMHGNTVVTADGLKTRPFADILNELERAFDLHAACGSRLGGVHIELTGENVTECIGGARGLTEGDLRKRYRTEVDPRLNGEQALEMAMLMARKMKRIGG